MCQVARQSPGYLDTRTQHIYEHPTQVPRHLKIDQMRWVYMGPDGSHWDLAGRHAGRQGAVMVNELGGHHWPFEHLLSESAYEMGATWERTNVLKRVTPMGVVLGGSGYTSTAYEMIESHWWHAWPEETPGWLGAKTLTGGWRWHQVQLAEAVKSPMKKDPRYAGNNVMIWDMSLLGCKPWYARRMLVESWTATESAVADHGYDEHVFSIANRGQIDAHPLFIYTPPGRAWVQDGMTSRMQELPLITDKDGYVLVNTDPAEPTLSASKDPVDNMFYDLGADFVMQSRVLSFFLHDLASLTLPVWRRQPGIRFMSKIPPHTVANLKVRHSRAGGQVICLMPQRYKRPSS
jgi:hypothetical protein